MQRRPKSQRFRLRDSDRSGFTYKEISLVKDGGRLVGSDEFDQPPPSTKSLGGEGEISGEARTTADQFVYEWTTGQAATVYALQADVALAPVIPDPSSHAGNVLLPWMQVAGSLQAITMTANPQIVAGQERQVLTVECVGSGVTFIHSNGLALMAGNRFSMTSGSVITFQYNSANGVWSETSRTA